MDKTVLLIFNDTGDCLRFFKLKLDLKKYKQLIQFNGLYLNDILSDALSDKMTKFFYKKNKFVFSEQEIDVKSLVNTKFDCVVFCEF